MSRSFDAELRRVSTEPAAENVAPGELLRCRAPVEQGEVLGIEAQGDHLFGHVLHCTTGDSGRQSSRFDHSGGTKSQPRESPQVQIRQKETH
jgi:hypothetical protein